MGNAHDEQQPQVIVAEDGLTAALRLPRADDAEAVTEEACLTALTDAGVEITDAVRAAAAELLEAWRAEPEQEREGVVARGEPARHGVDGRLEFEPGLDPGDEESEQPQADVAGAEASQVDHYQRSAFKIVRPGERIGRLTPPIEGARGRDVCGKPLEPRTGAPYPLIADPSIEEQEGGVLVAKAAGALRRRRNVVRVLTTLEIPQNVDFSTGNINFPGDIDVGEGVRDCFVVDADGSVCIRGLVEAATIRAGVDAWLDGGMAAREKGSLRISRDLYARYLNNVEGIVGRHLRAEREIVNCRLDVAGCVLSESCVVKGGRLSSMGKCALAEIGSASGGATEVVLGRAPELERFAAESGDLLEDISSHKDRLRPEHEPLAKNVGRLTEDQRQRLRDVSQRMKTLDDMSRRIARADESLRDAAARHREIDLTVQRRIHQGVRVLLGEWEAHFREPVAGPLRIALSEQGQPVIIDLTRSGGQAPLDQYASVSRVEDPAAEGQRAA